MLAMLLLSPTEAAPAPSPAPAPATLESLLLAKLLFLKGMAMMEATKPMTIEKTFLKLLSTYYICLCVKLYFFKF